MKRKDYKHKREELKKEKREVLKEGFDNGDQRKNFINGVKRTYRSLKRSEKQAIQKQIEDEQENESRD